MTSKTIRLREFLTAGFDRPTMRQPYAVLCRLGAYHNYAPICRSLRLCQSGCRQESVARTVSEKRSTLQLAEELSWAYRSVSSRARKEGNWSLAWAGRGNYSWQAVERVRAGESFSYLSLTQKRALFAFKIPTAGGGTRAALASDRDGSSESEQNFLSVIIDDVETQREHHQAATGGIRPTRHILGVNSICERLFSRTKLIVTDSRKCMDPSTLETLIMLRTNKSLRDVQDVWSLTDHPRYFDEVNNDEEPHSRASRRLRERDDDDDSQEYDQSGETVSTTSASSSNNNSSSAGRSRVLPSSGWRPPSGPVRSVRPRIS